MDKIIFYCGAALPSIIASVIMLILTRKISKAEKHSAEQIKAQLLMLKMVSSTMALSEATAIAIRDGKTNGETKAAMSEVTAAKKAYYEFLNEEAFEHITE